MKLSDQLYAYNVPRPLLYWVVVQGVAALVLDLYIFFLPMPIVSKLQLQPRVRLQVFGMFSTAMK